jgi:hypothetical protein
MTLGMEVVALAGFLDVQNFTAFVVAALGAGSMRHFALVAVRTFREGMALERVMGAPASGTRFRVSTFWIGHLNSFQCTRERPRSCRATNFSWQPVVKSRLQIQRLKALPLTHHLRHALKACPDTNRTCATGHQISLPTCCADLSVPSNADLLSAQRKSSAPSSDSHRNVGKGLCSPRGR